MRKAILLPIAAAAALGLSGCGHKAANEAAEANEAITGDSNTMGEAVNDTKAADAAAIANAESAYDNVSGGDDSDGNVVYD